MTARVDKAPSLDRRATATCLIAVLLAACTLGASGCSVCQHARRTLIQEPLEYSSKGDRARSLKAYRQWADEAWSVERRACPDVADNADYALGFRDGFVDYIYAGGDGQPPPVPPRKFWNVGWRTPEGDVGAQQWFAGYRHGAQSARNSGLRQNGVVLSSYLALGQMEGPSSPADGVAPPSYHGESLSDPQEPLPSPNGGIVPPAARDAGGSAAPLDGEGLSYPPGINGSGATRRESSGVGPDPQTSNRTGSYTGIVPLARSASAGRTPVVPFEPIQPIELPATDGFDVANAVQQAIAAETSDAATAMFRQAVGETALDAAQAPTASTSGVTGVASTEVGLSTAAVLPGIPGPAGFGGASAAVPAMLPTNPSAPATSDAAERFRRASVPEQDGAAAFPVDRPLVIEPSGDGSATSATQRFRRAVSPLRSPEPSTTH